MLKHVGALCGVLLLALPVDGPRAAEPPAQVADAGGVAPPYVGELPSLAALNIRDARLQRVLEGLQRPWAFEFLADDEVLITEIGGRLLRYRYGATSPTVIAGLPPIATGSEQAGLLDVALHPRFTDNRRIYFSFVNADPEAPAYTLTAVATAVLGAAELTELRVILEAGPYGWSPSNFGGALAFDAQGWLYVSIGDRSEHDLAQRGDRLQGKILRLADDGTVPADNPFVGDPAVDDRIYALGVRNPQGLAFDRVHGRLFAAEHGPLGGDEVNLIEAGANYGWPTVTYGRSYDTSAIGIGTHAPGMRQPLFHYTPSIAVSPLAVYRGSMFPEWDGDLLVGALKGQQVSRLDLDGDVVRSEYRILTELGARIRDLKVGADGALFVLAETGVLYRLYREPESPGRAAATDPATIYHVVCAGCHASGAYRAPVPGAAGDWERILAQPAELSFRRTLEGYGAMPPRGLCYQCTDAQLRAAVDYLLGKARGD